MKISKRLRFTAFLMAVLWTLCLRSERPVPELLRPSPSQEVLDVASIYHYIMRFQRNYVVRFLSVLGLAPASNPGR
jgi:hypothetical protein